MVLDHTDPIDDSVGRVHPRYLSGRRSWRPRKLRFKFLRVSSRDCESRAGAESAFDVVSLLSWSHGNFLVSSLAWEGELGAGRAVHFDVGIISS